jgi:ankyrin repeat protein
MKLLTQGGADLDGIDRKGYTPLNRALANGHEAVERLLIDKGADVNVRTPDFYRYTALICALQNGHEAVAGLLIDKGADVNAHNKHGWTAFIWASENGHKAVAQLLIDKGAGINFGYSLVPARRTAQSLSLSG